MTKFLITGFSPFGGNDTNPSEKAVRALPDIENADISKLYLPVSWSGAAHALEREISILSPDVVIMTGLAGGSDRIRIERVAVNLRGALRDNDGLYPDASEFPVETECVPGGDTAYFSTFDFRNIYDEIKKAGLPVSYSYSAGTYLCNDILYHALYKNQKEKRNMRVGFIHLPYEKCPQNDPRAFTMSIDDSVKAIAAAVAASVNAESVKKG